MYGWITKRRFTEVQVAEQLWQQNQAGLKPAAGPLEPSHPAATAAVPVGRR
jgi:hypothetical protein